VSENTFTVKGFRPEAIEAGEYPAIVSELKLRPSSFGEQYVQWIFRPEGFPEDVEVVGSTSLAAGRTAKGMEWARRILGKSSATDMKWGRDLKEKRPVIDWGPDNLVGKPCRVVVEKNYDEDEEVYRNRVVNVLPPADGEDLEGVDVENLDMGGYVDGEEEPPPEEN
jgi:hypothetical protein